MANPTTNFGWQMPTATDLVTDLPADFEVFGQAVDTNLAGLLGGTTGQVLSKTSGTDLDFTWITDATGMANPMTTTGDVIYSSSGSTPARLGIGSVADVLTVDGSGVPTWAAPGGSAKNWSLISTTAMTGSSISFTGLTLDNYILWVETFTGTSGGQDFGLRLNASSTAADYDNFLIYPAQLYSRSYRGILSRMDVGNVETGGDTGNAFIELSSLQQSGQKQISSVYSLTTTAAVTYQTVNGFFNPSAAVTEFNLFTSGGTFNAGTVYLYGAA